MTSMADQPCYTLMTNPQEGDFPNEQDLKNDLGRLLPEVSPSHCAVCVPAHER